MIRARLTLLAVAFAAGAVWRAEVEWRGWPGLTWITYFHWAIPLGALAFSGWLHRHAGARRPRALAALALALAAVAYVAESSALEVVYSRWPMSEGRFLSGAGQALLVFWLYPTAVWIGARLLGAPVTPLGALAGLIAYAAAMPLAMMLLDVMDHRGGSDVLHAIKSGVVIPLLVGSLGLPFVVGRSAATGPAPGAAAGR